MNKLLLAMLFISSHAAGGEVFIKGGIGVNSRDPSTTKLISLGYQEKLYKLLDYQLEVGGFSDRSQPQGLVGFAGVSLGTSVVTPAGIYAKAFVGPALVTQTDTRLSSEFEFNIDTEVGLRSRAGNSIGINFKHLSNAGFWPPNLGRDFLLLKCGFAL